MSTATPFSYAQAARGRTTSQASPQPTSPAPSTTGPQSKDETPANVSSQTATSVTVNGADVKETEQNVQQPTESAAVKQESEASSVAGGPAPSTISTTEQSGKNATESGKQPESRRGGNSEDKSSRSTSRTSRVNDSSDGRKGRKGKKGRSGDKDEQNEQNQEEEAEKVKEPPKPVILTEAPVPAVNPWAQRMEAQKAKAKLAAQQASEASSPAAGGDSKAQETSGAAVNGDKWAKKPGEQAARRNGPRGGRANDKDDKPPVALPPVADPASWPDPKAAAEQRDQAKNKQIEKHEKSENAEEKGQEEAAPSRKKTWEKLDIVPSVVFETQLPIRGSKPRGGARGGREAGSMRGSHSSTSGGTSHSAFNSVNDKSASSGVSTGARPATTRPREGSLPVRSAPQSQQAQPSKRAPADGPSREQRKPAAPANSNSTADQARDAPSADVSSVSHPHEASGRPAPHNRQSSFAAGANRGFKASKRSSTTRDIRTENGGSVNSETGQTAARSAPQERITFQGRSDNHNNASGQYPARDGRPERGRGGYRARGGHNGASSHISSGSFAANGHYTAPGAFGPRQNHNPHSPSAFSGQYAGPFGHSGRGRGNKWAGAGQSAGRGSHSVSGFPPKPAQVADFAVPQYTQYMYTPIYDPTISILKAQVEYYLSVENLCKDHYLRQHMDGQGFVHLSTIAGFKRIKAVTEELELLRFACSLSDQIEFGVGEDGIERLRIREKWQHFVLPVHERLEAYRNNGPTNFVPYMKPDAAQFAIHYHVPFMAQPYPPVAAPGTFLAYPEDPAIFQAAYANGVHYDPTIAVNGAPVNGVHGHHDSRLSAGVPEYSPPQSPVTLESMTNFSDAQVENMMVILGYEEKEESGVAGYVSEKPEVAANEVAPISAEEQR